MAILEEVIDELEELDEYRRKAANMRDAGQRALVKLFGKAPAYDLDALLPTKTLSGATVLKALLVQRRMRVKRMGQDAAKLDELTRAVASELENTPTPKIFATRPDRLHILRAARAMSTLVTAPDSAFSRTVFVFYYVIVREIFTADTPDWTLGGARAGEASAPSAYVTAECTRAIMGLRGALVSTALYIRKIADMRERRERASKANIPGEWLRVDEERAALEFLTTFELQKGNIALKLEPLRNVHDLDRFLAESPADIEASIRKCFASFGEALQLVHNQRVIERARLEEKYHNKPADAEKRINRSESAHLLAQGAVEWARDQAEKTIEVFVDKSLSPVEKLKKVADLFDEAAVETSKILQPAREFLARVLDRELAAASANLSWDAAELVFAAVAHGYIRGRWDDERLVHASKFLAGALSPRGRFPIGQPLFSNSDGFSFHVLNSEALRAFAQLLQHVPAVELSPDLARRMLVFLEDTQFDDPLRSGLWHNDEPAGSKAPRAWITATAVYALDRINRMLDARINRRIFDFFTVRTPAELVIPPLTELFYPDYGLVQQKVGPAREARPRESVAAVLERMRAHVAGVADDQRWGNVVWSLILYGPPGTGKTTLVESLAKSCNVPIVDVTPSDIVVQGVDQVERRARAVFKALSLLTRVVIMFDEFEPVLQKRREDDRNPNVFSFVTPGMLPKLKTLHDMAERRGVAYVLNTNILNKLDDAATRAGRFDARLGVYPPDVLSRVGRLFSEVHLFQRELAPAQEPELTAEMKKRAWDVVQKSVAGPMNTLGKLGWYSRPKQIGTGRRNAFEYIFSTVADDRYEVPAPEARFTEHAGNQDVAQKELYDWMFSVTWDEAIQTKKLSDLAATKGIAVMLDAAPDEKEVAKTIKKLKLPEKEQKPAQQES
jgi:hypothetical protein